MMKLNYAIVFLFLLFGFSYPKEYADTILINGKIITVDHDFSVAEAVAIKNGKFMAIGKNKTILALAGKSTVTIDLKGRSVIPGLIDGHAHPFEASQSEFVREIPAVNSIKELLDWVHKETQTRKKGAWIVHPKFFITRMVDMRQLTLNELDSVSPDHPVFLNGSYGGMVNSKAIEVSGLASSDHSGIIKDNATGKPIGMIRSSAFPLLKIDKDPALSTEEKLTAIKKMLYLYNSVGITSICSGSGNAEHIRVFNELMNKDELTVRIFQNILLPFDTKSSVEEMHEALQKFGYKTGDGNDWVRVGALKAVIDGGVLTGTAYLREAWGDHAQALFGFADSSYRGELFLSEKRLAAIITVAAQEGWKFTAHVTGGGGVDTLLAAYEEVNQSIPLNGKRFAIIHGNFFNAAALDKMRSLGLCADMQPAWFYKDASFLFRILGKERLALFHPYRTMFDAGVEVGGGSDHMVKLDPDLGINPYNPFPAMWSVITRKTVRGDTFNKEEALTRKQALEMYTINNAYPSFDE
ncbi:MAG: amidohydrolase, partial [Flavitalea sp.]